MKPVAGGYRVAVIGAASLLGKELLAVLKERQFPVARLVTPNALDDSGPDLPVLDLSDSIEPVIINVDISEGELDFVFIAAPFPPSSQNSRLKSPFPPASEISNLKSQMPAGEPAFLRLPHRLAAATHCRVIDMIEGLGAEAGGVLSVPFLDRSTAS